MSITLAISDDIARITLDDGRANAIDPPWLDSFLEVFAEAEQGAKAIVIAGREGIFSGGFNLKWMPTANLEELTYLLTTAGKLVARVYGSERPVVAACTGHAIAMGMFLLLSCDTRIGARGEFKFGANETMNGMNLPVFAQQICKARLEKTAITRLLVQAAMFGPDEAVSLGALDQVVEADAVIDTATQVAARLAQLPGGAYGWNKQALRADTIARIEASKDGF